MVLEYLSALASQAMAAWQGLSLLQQAIVGALGLLVGYWVIRALMRAALRITMAVALLVAVAATLRAWFPKALCGVPWPSQLAWICPG